MKTYKSNIFTPFEIAQEIDKNMNPKKAPDINKISPRVLKELSRKTIVFITYIFNACLRLEHILESFKIAQIIMINKPDKPVEETKSYKPISLFLISKLFEKLLYKQLKLLLSIPDHQFGFRNQHSTIDQIHRISSTIEKTAPTHQCQSYTFAGYRAGREMAKKDLKTTGPKYLNNTMSIS